MAKIEGLTRVVKALQSKAAKARKDSDVSVVVGYSTAYAIFIHENIEMKWRGLPRDPRLRDTKSGKHQENPRPRQVNPKGEYWGPHGEAKFLEKPARELSNSGTLGGIVLTAMKAGKTMAQALLLAGLRLQRESQQLVPIDTGTLKNSAFTTLEKGSEA